MRREVSSRSARLRRAALALVVGACSVFPLAASAGSYHDSVYADSFGNLVIHSPSGYKRIIVGQGHLARELGDYTRAGAEPDVVYAQEEREASYGYGPRCNAPGVLLHGRSYMYGLPDNVVPVLRHPCR